MQAYTKLLRGEFSNSSRITSFLSTISRFQVQVQHVSGSANLPSDYASRHPVSCPDGQCQVCKFIHETEDSVIRSLTVRDVLDGLSSMPFLSRTAWLASQHECHDIRRTHAHLTQGTRPSKKMTKISSVKRYLQVASIARDGLLIVKESMPFSPTRERIVVPQSMVDGLITALHYKFDHPTRHQMKKVFNRHYYALNFDQANERVASGCAHCVSLKSVPKPQKEQSSEDPPDRIGTSFAADIMKRYKQLILVLRILTKWVILCKTPSLLHIF